jgi:hypothetical protein
MLGQKALWKASIGQMNKSLNLNDGKSPMEMLFRNEFQLKWMSFESREELKVLLCELIWNYYLQNKSLLFK